MSILFSAVNPWAPISQTSVAGTSAQVMTGAVLTIGGVQLNGKAFWLELQGYFKAHGAAQTFAIGFQGQKYSTSAFSGTQLGTGTASGTATAGTVYPFSLAAWLTCDNTSGILTGSYAAQDGITPTLKAPTILAATITGVNFGQATLSNPGNPIGSSGGGNAAPALQFAPTFTNGVSDTSTIVTVTSFYCAQD